jgi:NAD(P)-dependent dehydrogenase (short-subunit alcohol dehydrogenase family)
VNYRGFDLSGRVALVTGAAQGIGRALAAGLAQAGAHVAVTDRLQVHGLSQQLCDEITAAGGLATAFDLDVTDTPAIPAVMASIRASLGGLDILVNNAGTGISRAALEVSEADWDRILDLNLKSQFFCAQAAARLMAEQGHGQIINIASTHALIALPDGSPYIASKGGVASLTRSLALEWIKLGIRVNAIAPGPVHTAYKAQADLALGRTPESIQADMQRRVPLGRRLQPEELVGAAIYLASEASRAVVGHVLVVDGGQVIQ